MSETFIPPWIIPEKETHEWIDESVVFRSAFASGRAQRQSYGGLRLKLSRSHTVRGEEKSQLLSVLKSTRGQYNALRTKVHFALRGSGLGSEVLSNNTFASGTTGWSTTSGISAQVAERIYRGTRIAPPTSTQAVIYKSASVTQYAPYMMRAFVLQGQGSPNVYLDNVGVAQLGLSTQAYGMRNFWFVATSASINPGVSIGAVAGGVAGDYIEIPYVSLARCGFVDAGVNSLLRSDEFDNATWLKTALSVSAGATTGPTGSSDGDAIVEDGSSGDRYIFQSLTVSALTAEYALAFTVKAGTRSWCSIQMDDSTGALAKAWFNLSTGVVGTTTTTAGFSNLRTFVRDLGNGWYDCYILATKSSVQTTLSCVLRPANADNSTTYTGVNGSTAIYARRASLIGSFDGLVPMRLVQTTSAAVAGTVASGSGIYVRGLPASTSGILLPGDWFEISGELKQCTSALNSDSAGLGFLQFEPPLVNNQSDGNAVVITDPFGKFLVSNIKIDNEFGTQARVSYDLEHIYE
jgi:hypothetical protein